jgi:3-oxoacyl-[acyl-carrier-protein] synthase II
MRRVVITGAGAVSPCGNDLVTSWDNIVAGKSGIATIEGFDASKHASKIAGECTGFDPEKYIEKKRLREMGRFIHLAIAASQEAMESAGFEPDDALKERTGTFIGVGMCAMEIIEKNAKALFDKGPRRVSPYFIPSAIANLAPGQVSMRFDLKGPSYTTTSACSSGAHAIGEAFKWIQRGDCDAALAGGAEAAVTPLGVGGFTALRALSVRNDEPEKASRPFDKGRDGFVIGEGAGVMVLEEREAALARGANIIAEVVGYGATADAYHLTQPAPEGEGAQRAMRMALTDAKVDRERVDYINAHGTSTPTGDMQELLAINAVFGEHARNGLWVSSTKSMHGHLLGGAGGLEAVLTALAIRDGVAPPTINLDDPEEGCEGLELVPHEARKRDIGVALSNSFGFGGTNVTLALSKHG